MPDLAADKSRVRIVLGKPLEGFDVEGFLTDLSLISGAPMDQIEIESVREELARQEKEPA